MAQHDSVSTDGLDHCPQVFNLPLRRMRSRVLAVTSSAPIPTDSLQSGGGECFGERPCTGRSRQRTCNYHHATPRPNLLVCDLRPVDRCRAVHLPIGSHATHRIAIAQLGERPPTS
jgi:hypothetical protein